MSSETEAGRGHTVVQENQIDPDAPIWGVKNIAPIIGRTERQTFHLLKTGQLPAKKLGGSYVSTYRKLMSALLGEAA